MTQSWRVAEALETLYDEVDTRWPTRLKGSDGSIGDFLHSLRPSAHNPDEFGVVRARDFTNDPISGCYASVIAERARMLGASGDPRMQGEGLVIWNWRKASEKTDWEWARYWGVNGHTKHCHVGVSYNPANYDRIEAWGLLAPKPISLPPATEDDDMAVIVRNRLGKAVSTNYQTYRPILKENRAVLLNVAGLEEIMNDDLFDYVMTLPKAL